MRLNLDPSALAARRRQLAIRDQLNTLLGKHLAGGGESQNAKFRLPGLAQAGLACLQTCVVVAGMANEFPRAFGDAAGNRIKQRLVEDSGYHDTESTVGRGEPLPIHGLAELASEAAQNPDFSVASPQAGARQ
jgi:hypothetical protein